MQLNFVYSIIFFILGLLIGSFLNVCIYRIPIGKTIIYGRSYCPHCNSLIPWYLNIPILSFIALKGRCKNCKGPISFRYPAVELLTGLMFLIVYLFYGFSFECLFVISLFTLLIIISFIDFDHQIIPDQLVLFLLVISIFNCIYRCIYLNDNFLYYLGGAFAASGVLFILGLIIKDSIGGGDIKLMAAAGVFLGFKLILLALFIGAIYAAVYSIFIVLFKKANIKTVIPFGPFLSLGIATAVLFGESIFSLYFSMFI